MIISNKNILSALFVVVSFLCFGQEGVRNGAEKKELTGKIMIVPFEPKMYMSDIDQKVNAVTKWNSASIIENFRHQLDNQLKLKFQSVLSPVLTFYADSAKTSKDLDFIYKSTSISFDLVDKPSDPTVAAVKKQNGVKNGQIVVEVSNTKKFSNIKFNTTDLISYLNKKYQCEYFVFINELDINTIAESYDIASDSYQREVTVHYTIVDKTSKLIAAGAATSRFNSKVNEPKKIVSQTFSLIATYLATKFSLAITPKK
jgi:hypothetical protein